VKPQKYKVAPDDADKHLSLRRVSEDGLLEIGVYPVAFGWRVRAGFVDSQPELDYCAGADHTFLEVLYSLTLAALERGVPLDTFPFQAVKPFYNDPQNFKELIKLAGDDYERIFLTRPTRFNAG